MASNEVDVTGRRRKSSMDTPSQFKCFEGNSSVSAELRIVLFSSRSHLQFIISNCILGRQVFMPAEGSLSQSLKNHEETEGRKVSVINTPNFFEKDHTQRHIRKELKRCVCLSCPGPHAVLLTLDLEDISATDVHILEELTKYFGDNILKYTILLLCHEGKEENPNLDDGLQKNLREIMDKCGHQYHLFNKNSVGAEPLLERIESLVAENGDRFFTNYKYEEIEGSIRKEETFIEKGRETELKKMLHELDSIYEGEELKRERDQYLNSVRAEIRKEAERIILDRLGIVLWVVYYADWVLGGAVQGQLVRGVIRTVWGVVGGIAGALWRYVRRFYAVNIRGHYF